MGGVGISNGGGDAQHAWEGVDGGHVGGGNRIKTRDLYSDVLKRLPAEVMGTLQGYLAHEKTPPPLHRRPLAPSGGRVATPRSQENAPPL